MNKLVEKLIAFSNSDIFVFALYAYLFGIIMYIVYSVLNYFKYYSRMRKTMQSIYNRMNDSDRERAEKERRERDIHGITEKTDFLDKIDQEIIYSGIKGRFPWITTELYIISILIIEAIIISVATLFANVIIGIVAAFVFFIITRVIITILINRRNSATEENMLQLMNIIDNFSKTSDDLIVILERTARYIDDPLASQIQMAVTKARSTGDSYTAIEDLQNEVKNEYFKILMRNLQISSRMETNYSDIIEDCRESYHLYLQNQKEKKNIRINGFTEIIVMLIIGVFCMFMVSDVTDSGNLIATLLDGGAIGKGILGIVIVSLLGSLYVMVLVLKEK